MLWRSAEAAHGVPLWFLGAQRSWLPGNGEGGPRMRLVTRGDLDGLTCAVLITSCEAIGEILLVHPQDVTDRRVAITDEDIMANLPYDEGCARWFDHPLLTESNQRPPETFDGRYGLAPSA